MEGESESLESNTLGIGGSEFYSPCTFLVLKEVVKNPVHLDISHPEDDFMNPVCGRRMRYVKYLLFMSNLY